MFKFKATKTIHHRIGGNWETWQKDEEFDAPESEEKVLLLKGAEKVCDKEVKLTEGRDEVVSVELDFKKMTKDELNDFAAKNGFEDEISSSMLKSEMIKKLEELME